MDSLDGTLTGELSITNTVNTDVIGEYSVMFDVKDKAGNLAEAVRIVHITDDSRILPCLAKSEMIIGISRFKILECWLRTSWMEMWPIKNRRCPGRWIL